MDILDFLESREIDFKLGGKNISKGWVGISCLFCGDHSTHMGINKSNGMFSCWNCDEKGNFIKLISEIDGVNFHEAKKIAQKYDFKEYEEKEFTPYSGKILPKECKKHLPNLHINYLKSRNFNPYFLIKKYQLQACNTIGKYRLRIIAPIIINHQYVSFVAADVTRKSNFPYRFPPNDKVKLPLRSCLYNIDSVKSQVIIVEGITDVWRIGGSVVATLGKYLTQEQLSLLLQKEVVRAVVIPDNDAIESGEKIANQLSGIIDDVEFIELPAGDPADLNVDEVKDLKREFLI
jgi:DNA primase